MTDSDRPCFMDEISHAYTVRRRNVLLLTGDVHDIFWSNGIGKFVPLERALALEYAENFTVARMDISTGLSFYDEESEKELIRVCESTDGTNVPRSRKRNLKELIQQNRHNPLATLVLLEDIAERFASIRKTEEKVKPLCVILQHAGSMFPQGDFRHLSELDRQRLVFFLSWVNGPAFAGSRDLLLLVNSVMSEVNSKILALPNTSHIEIQLPDETERCRFVEEFTNAHKVRFETSKEDFCRDTAGLTVVDVNDLLGVASRTEESLTDGDVVAKVNEILQAQLGDIIRITHPTHTPLDIIGYQKTGNIIRSIFERCEDPETAISSIIVSGPNGGGKTFQLEAYAGTSGRVVIELVGLRGSLFGETDRFFELLRWHIATLGKVLILVDEAHTAFGSVHARDAHQTEKRLAGNVIKMMSDQSMLGKVLWGLMTSRPDELDPDVKSRSPIQIPIFDLDGDERKEFVREIFSRKDIPVNEEDLERVMTQTDYYSARDYRSLVAEVLAQRKKHPKVSVVEVLHGWQASRSIMEQREFQMLIAAQHCSYPDLLTEKLKGMSDEEVSKRIDELKWSLQR